MFGFFFVKSKNWVHCNCNCNWVHHNVIAPCLIQDKVKTQLEVEDLAEHEKMGEEELFTDISDTASDTREATKVCNTSSSANKYQGTL